MSYKDAEPVINSEVMADVENRFTYHPPTGDQPERYDRVRTMAKAMAILICWICPHSRERSLALTNLEQAVMWANASIARNSAEAGS